MHGRRRDDLTRDYLTIEEWKTEPRWRRLVFEEPASTEVAPALWKDLTLASVAVAALWAAALLLS
jgi:hypothetical protein